MSDHGTDGTDGSDRSDRLAAFWRFLADAEFRDYCPIYARIGTAFADDAEMVARLAGVTDEQKVEPVLCLAAVKHLAGDDPDGALSRIYDGRSDADPWPPFRALLAARFADVAELMRTRTIQTNEVGRAAFTAPMLDLVHRHTGERPIRLIELGPSAGLNLFLDRFHIDYGEAGTCGPPDSPVRLSCTVLDGPGPALPGPALPGPALPGSVPPIVDRVGIDVNPLDVTDPDHVRWLEACLWPGLTDRLERFRAAVAVARADPPDLRRGDALDLLPGVLAETPVGAVPLIVSTWVLAYFSPEGRARVGEILAAHAATSDRPVAAITGEYPSIAPWVGEPPRAAAIDEPRGASLLGVGIWAGQQVQSAPIAWVQAHGRWIDWLAGAGGVPVFP